MQTESGAKSVQRDEVRSVSRQWRQLWRDKLPLGEADVSGLISAFESNAPEKDSPTE